MKLLVARLVWPAWPAVAPSDGNSLMAVLGVVTVPPRPPATETTGEPVPETAM